ncbi:hypothetical protein [Streptomyces sp. SAS_270]|uniref:hypothetical protein n=1 Tax=Streptomyces sp. SAS_270 TaxID=3412748 RepID=UPI00403D3591
MLLFLACHLFGEDVAVDVRVDGGENQALEFVGFEGFDFRLRGVVNVKAVAAGEGRPSRMADGRACPWSRAACTAGPGRE